MAAKKRMECRIIEAFDWFDIQREICEEMGIDERFFREYHMIAGGEHKDLWHEWLEYFESNVINDHIIENDLGESFESKLEWAKEDGKEWLEPFLRAIYEVWDRNGIEWVRYSW